MKKLILFFGLFLSFGGAAFAAADEGNVEEAMAEYMGRDGATGLTNYCNGSMSSQFYEQLLLHLASQIKGELVESYGAIPQLYFSQFHVEKLEGYLSTNKVIFGQTITSDNKRGALNRLLKIARDQVVSDPSLVSEPKISAQREEIRRSSLEEVIKLYINTDRIDVLREKLRYLLKKDMIQFMYQASLSQIKPYSNVMKEVVTYSPLWHNQEFLVDMIEYALDTTDTSEDYSLLWSVFDTMDIVPFVKQKLNDVSFKNYLVNKYNKDIIKKIEEWPVIFEDPDLKQILENIARYEQFEEKERRKREAESREADHEYAVRVANQERYEELLHQGFTILSTMFRDGEAPITNSNDLIKKMNQIGDRFFRQGPPPPMHHHVPHGFFGGFGHHPSAA